MNLSLSPSTQTLYLRWTFFLVSEVNRVVHKAQAQPSEKPLSFSLGDFSPLEWNSLVMFVGLIQLI